MRSLVEEVVLYNKPVEFDRRYGESLTELLCNPWKPEDMPRINVPTVGSGSLLKSDPIGTHSDFQKGSSLNIFKKYELDQITGDPSLKNFHLQERFDLSHHGGTPDHINYGWGADSDIIKERRAKSLTNYEDILLRKI